jgi:hypothetical protein
VPCLVLLGSIVMGAIAHADIASPVHFSSAAQDRAAGKNYSKVYMCLITEAFQRANKFASAEIYTKTRQHWNVTKLFKFRPEASAPVFDFSTMIDVIANGIDDVNSILRQSQRDIVTTFQNGTRNDYHLTSAIQDAYLQDAYSLLGRMKDDLMTHMLSEEDDAVGPVAPAAVAPALVAPAPVAHNDDDAEGFVTGILICSLYKTQTNCLHRTVS